MDFLLKLLEIRITDFMIWITFSELEAPRAEAPNKRGDTFFRTVLRREGNVTQEDALDNTKTLDKT